MFCAVHLFFLLTLFLNVSSLKNVDYGAIDDVYQHDLAARLGNGTLKGLQEYFSRHHLKTPANSTISDCFMTSSSDGSMTVEDECLLKKCLTPADVRTLTGIESNSKDGLSKIATVLLHVRDNELCNHVPEHREHGIHHIPPSSIEVWGYGILCTTVISICSLGGLIALPFVHKTVYNKILIYMVGLAVGTLVGSSLLFLIPEALELTEQELDEHSYIWKCLVVMSGIYVFYIIERILKILTAIKEEHSAGTDPPNEMQHGAFATFHDAEPESEYKRRDTLPHMAPCGDDLSKKSDTDECMNNGKPVQNGHTNVVPHKHSHHVAPVAWMIIFGDGLHNFIDGVSIGAAFTESILAGVSVSVAILCEELPHELGDFAVLLNAGMRIKKAVCYNFLSACMCYLGLIVGVFLGENTAAHVWVFAFAGGMFLYISLVDMMPEMSTAAESKENRKTIGSAQIFILQNLGLLTGFGVMVVMAVYGGNLEAAIRGEQ